MNEDPKYPLSDWQYEVANGDTKLGYEDWKQNKREADLFDHGDSSDDSASLLGADPTREALVALRLPSRISGNNEEPKEEKTMTNEQKAKVGLDLLRQARDIFVEIDNKRTADRVRSAISSAKGAVRIQASRRVRDEIEARKGA